MSGQALLRSDAALAVVAFLPGWRWAGCLRIFPRPLRDAVYTLTARNRYRLFGRHSVCNLADRSFADRIITEVS